MADKIFPQDGDTDSGVNFSEWIARANLTNYVEEGLSLSADFTNNVLDVSAGRAYIMHGDEDKLIIADQRTGLALPDSSGTNVVYLDPTFSVNDEVAITILADGSTPSGAYLRLGTVDTQNETVTEENRAPSIETEGGSLGDIGDDEALYFGADDDFGIQYNSSRDSFDFFDNLNDQQLWEAYKEGPFEFHVDVDLSGQRIWSENDTYLDFTHNDGSFVINLNGSDSEFVVRGHNDEDQLIVDHDGIHIDTVDLGENITIPGDIYLGGSITKDGNDSTVVVDGSSMDDVADGSYTWEMQGNYPFRVYSTSYSRMLLRLSKQGRLDLTGDLDLNRNNILNVDDIESGVQTTTLRTDPRGGGVFEVADGSSGNRVARFHADGNLEVPNGYTSVSGGEVHQDWFYQAESGYVGQGDCINLLTFSLDAGATVVVTQASFIATNGSPAPSGASLVLARLDNQGDGNVSTVLLSGDGSSVYDDETGNWSYTNTSGSTETIMIGLDNGHFDNADGGTGSIVDLQGHVIAHVED